VRLPDGQPVGAPVGTIQGVEGEVLVVRADGTVVAATAGTPLYRNDTVETFGDGRAEIGFVDQSTITVEPNARLGIDEYAYDPDAGAGSVSFLRSLFLFTDGLLGERQSFDDGVTGGGPGIRGSAEEIIKNDLLANPEPGLGQVGIWMETASPKTVWTFVELPDGPVTFSFDYAFLAAGSTLTATLGGQAIWQVEAGDAPIGTLQSVEMLLVVAGDPDQPRLHHRRAEAGLGV
jgi:hypothetical protein